MPGLEQLLNRELAGDVRFDEMSRGLYSTDASIYQLPPLGVVIPRDRADCLRALQIAAQEGVPVLPRGGGTSLSGQTVGRALVLDFSRSMNRILELDLDRQLVRVEPGVVLDQLNAALEPHGLQFGPDVATSNRANIGGMIGNNSAGSRSIRQGKTIDHVRELELLLADGTPLSCRPLDPATLAAAARRPGSEGRIYQDFPALVAEHRRDILARYPRLLRRVSGYNLDAFVPEIAEQSPVPPAVARLNGLWPDRSQFNLARLITGAEGTLGVVTEALLHVVPLPKQRGVVCLQFHTIDAALESVTKILGCEPSAIELLDRYVIELSRTNLKYRKTLDFVEGTPEALLIVEFSGDRAVDIADNLLLMEQRLREQTGLQKLLRAETPAQQAAIWNCRKAGAPLLLGIPGARKPIAFVEDTAVDPARLPAFTRKFRAILARHGITGSYYGHASVGCLHIRPMLDVKAARDRAILDAVSHEVADLVLEYGGAMSGEHGDGLARSTHNLKLFGPRLFHAFGAVKRLFDPDNRMNPGKIVARPAPAESLRYSPPYTGLPRHTTLDFSREARLAELPSGQGMLAAAEMCNGAGVCRKTLSGTMCPSYMATRDEEHSTRGRANALRLALSGQLDSNALASRRLYDVLDLCLMCKACKAECPSNVDLAKLKAEFLNQYYRLNRRPLGQSLLSEVAWINRLGSAFAPLSNWLPHTPGARWLAERLFDIDHRRTLPRFARRTFPRWWRQHRPHPRAGSRGRVVLLDDCLTSYCDPYVPRSAAHLLEHAGFEVVPANLWCCGRPHISKGRLDDARTLARRNLARLAEFVDAGLSIVGVEPSCLLTLVDEYPDLVPGPTARKVRDHARLLEHWLMDLAPSASLELDLQPLDPPPGQHTALLHGHCQQKALCGVAATRELLARVPGLTVRELDAGCCGMAGSFGYEHFDISQQIGERVLFPAVRAHVASSDATPKGSSGAASATGSDAGPGSSAASGPVVATGFSCRHQIAEATGVVALHPVQLLARQLRPAVHP